jgi:predicted acyltransferase
MNMPGLSEARPADRVASLDALRGFDMFWIIGGEALVRGLQAVKDTSFTRSLVHQVEHNPWAGFTFYDVIFPLFFLIIGAVMPFSLLKRAGSGEPKKSLYAHVIKRSLTLFLLGLVVGGVLRLDFANQRLMGVLQRIGLCYFLVSMLVLNTKKRTQGVVFAAVLLLYWAALALIPVPGYGAGQMTPEGSLHSYIDQKVLPGKFNPQYYGSGDSMGVLSTLPAACSILLGVFAGYWLKSARSAARKARGLFLGGLACLGLGYLWSLAFPIIKHIWTSSYMLWAGGWSLLLLAAFYWIIDVKGRSKWAFFFTVIGMNAILVYVGQVVVDFEGTSRFLLSGLARAAAAFGPLIIAAGALAAKWLVLRFLYGQRVFLKV